MQGEQNAQDAAEAAGAATGAVDEALEKALEDPMGFVEGAQEWLVQNGPDLAITAIKVLAVLVIGRWIAGTLRKVLRKVLEKRKVDPTLSSFLSSIVYMAMMTMVVISAVEVLDIQTTSFVAVIGAAGLAIGFALQDSLGNFASGVMIIFFRPFKAGDFVEVAGTSGVVLEVQVFATTLKTGDNKKIIVPNGSIIGGNIVNYSAHPTRRIDMVFGIGYDDDILEAKRLFERVLKEEERILPEPAPQIAVSELGDSSVNFVIRPWVKTSDYWPVLFDLTEKLKLECDKAGITIPYPQRDVHLHQVSA